MIEAMKQALKTFEKIHEGCGFVKEDDLHKDAKNLATYIQEDCDFTMRTLRQAIEQAEKQEPVAWLVRDYVDGFRYVSSTENPSGTIAVLSEPLYTAPPKREWVGLTDEEINDFDKKLRDHNDYCSLHFAWGISAKLKEKNGG
jgi:hypothetical protein